jgi:hypothetical protein
VFIESVNVKTPFARKNSSLELHFTEIKKFPPHHSFVAPLSWNSHISKRVIALPSVNTLVSEGSDV